MLIERLLSQTGLSRGQLDRFAESASKRYKVYKIPKRTGGERLIEQPAKEIKALQRWVNSRLINIFDVHSAATAYRRGSSIRSNAMRHARTRYTVRADFKDFFPSFSSSHVRSFLYAKAIAGLADLSGGDIEFVVNIVSRNERLTIGAPSSPALTNAMMFDFDKAMSDYAETNGLVYTRYADDIFVSSYESHQLDGVIKFIKSLSDNYAYANLKLNFDKTAYLSRKYSRSITGLVITPTGKVSLGRDRKREVKALVHKFMNGNLDHQLVGYTRGMVAFAYDSDPDFYHALQAKYGTKALRKIMEQREI